MARKDTSRVDLWVCEGRLCAAHGAEAVRRACDRAVAALPEVDRQRVRVLRGGCYGLCELGPNVVVRTGGHAEDPAGVCTQDEADRLTLRGGDDEHVCCAVTEADVPGLIRAVVDDGVPPAGLLRETREQRQRPKSLVEERMRALRRRRAQAASAATKPTS